MTYLSCEIIGSVTAACASTIVGHPLDTIKVQLQTQPQITSSIQAVRHLLKANPNNPLVLFRGMSFPLVNQIIMNTVMFSAYHKVQSYSIHSCGMSDFVASLTAGVTSGFATACVSTPTDYFKIQAQLANNKMNTMEAAAAGGGGGGRFWTTLQRLMMMNATNHQGSVSLVGNGLVRLYRGHGANLWREGIFTMVYLSGYDLILHSWQRQEEQHNNKQESTIKTNYSQIVTVSALTGALAWIASYPFDTMKSIIQAEASLGRDMTMRRIIADRWNTSGGMRLLFRGCGASTGRAMLVTSVRMVMYEWSTSFVVPTHLEE
jgi:hypothetical protein